ncbi:MAG: alpha/beta fold hydrolase [Chitinophagaceae bacterium]|nr:MAG: alpha/beta fold hydrolase [Chitinophagaceae bacterium]
MPIVKSTYHPPLYLLNRHVQTVIPFYYVKPDSTLYKTEKFELPDGDFLELDWIRDGNDKLMVMCHGLEGNSRSSYMQQTAVYFSKLGWDILAINTRGCGREINRLPVLYHGGSTQDIDAVVTKYADKYSSLVLVGFSLGANMLLNFAARHNTPGNLKATVGFSVPCDLRTSEQQIDRFIHHFYREKFLHKLKNKIRKLENLHPGIVDLSVLEKANTMQAFTRAIAAPLCGFNTINDYYLAGSSLNALAEIKVPTFIANAKNDPFLADRCYPTDIAKSSDKVFLDMPKHGGHASFPITNTLSWMPGRLDEFLKVNVEI